MSGTLEMNLKRILLVGVALLFATTSGCQKETDYGSFNDYGKIHGQEAGYASCLLYTSPSPRDRG